MTAWWPAGLVFCAAVAVALIGTWVAERRIMRQAGDEA